MLIVQLFTCLLDQTSKQVLKIIENNIYLYYVKYHKIKCPNKSIYIAYSYNLC